MWKYVLLGIDNFMYVVLSYWWVVVWLSVFFNESVDECVGK